MHPAPTIRTAIAGLGRWGKKIAIELDAATTLTAYASKSMRNNSWVQHHIPKLRRATFEEILADPTISAIAIATPINLLSELTESALNSGKHVLVEKPVADSSDQARHLSELAARRGLVLCAGYVFLYHPAYLQLKRILSGTRIRSVSLVWHKFGTFDETIEQNLLSHHLALAIDMVGEPTGGTMVRSPGRYSECDRIQTQLYYPDFTLTSDIDRAAPARRHSITVDLEDGRRLVWTDKTLTSASETSAPPETIYQVNSSALAGEVGAFVRAVQTPHQHPATGGHFAFRVLRLLASLTSK